MFTVQGPKHVLGLNFAPDSLALHVLCNTQEGAHALDLDSRALAPLVCRDERFVGEYLVHPNGRWAFGLIPAPKRRYVVVNRETGRATKFNAVNPWDHLAVSPNGEWAASIGIGTDPPRAGWSAFALFGWTFGARGPVQQWELRCPPSEDPWYVAFAGNDTLITEDRGYEPPVQRDDFRGNTRFSVRDPRTGKARARFDSPYDMFEARQLLAPPNGDQFVARRGTELHVWDTSDWNGPPRIVPGNANPRNHLARAAAFHPSGDYLLLATDAPSVTLFDARRWEPVRKWNWKCGPLRAVAVSADGALAAAAGPSGNVVVWDFEV